MGRKQEIALKWFPLDCDVFCNRKVKSLRRAHGQIGLLAYINILCRIYANGYYIKFDDINELSYDIAEEIANDHLASVSVRVASAISYMASIGLLSKDCLAVGVLTGNSVQENYMQAVKSMKRTAQIMEYNVTDSDFGVPKNDISSEETTISSEEKAVNSETTRQTRQKENVVNNISTIPTSTRARTREDWIAYMDEHWDLGFLEGINKTIDGEADVYHTVIDTLLNLLTEGNSVTIKGIEYSYDMIVKAVEQLNRNDVAQIMDAFYEADNVAHCWKRKHITNLTNYILSILMSKRGDIEQ